MDDNSARADSPSRTTIALWVAVIALALHGWFFYQGRQAESEGRENYIEQFLVAEQLHVLDPSFDIDYQDFLPGGNAREFLNAERDLRGRRSDVFHLDTNGNGTACDVIFDVGTGNGFEDLLRGSGGVWRWRTTDKDCQHFQSPQVAEWVYRHFGGKNFDPFGLDEDRDGDACEPFS